MSRFSLVRVKWLHLVLLLTIIFSINVTVLPQPVLACTQPVGGHPTSTIAERTNAADVVFEARVLSQDSDYAYAVTVEVVRYFKGAGEMTLTLGQYGTSALCLEEAFVGERYIFYANRSQDGQLWANYIGTNGLDSPTEAVIAQILETVVDVNIPAPPVGDIYPIYMPIIAK